MKLLSLTIVFALAIASPVHSSASKCPAETLLLPCRCRMSPQNKTVISCEGQKKFQIKSTFERLSDNLADEEKHFDAFYLNHSNIFELKENVFHDITFKKVKLLQQSGPLVIHPRALTATALTIEDFELTNYGPENLTLPMRWQTSLWDVLSSLVQARHVSVNSIYLNQVTTRAFRPLNGVQTRLRRVYLNTRATRFNDYAFYELHNVDWIMVMNDVASYNYMSKHAFDQRKSSDQTLEIGLENSRFNESGFAAGVFLGANRPMHIVFNYKSNFTYLPAEIFEPVLKKDKRNAVSLYDQRMVCDCRMFWLIKNRLDGRVRQVQCRNFNGTSFWDPIVIRTISDKCDKKDG